MHFAGRLFILSSVVGPFNSIAMSFIVISGLEAPVLSSNLASGKFLFRKLYKSA